MPVNCLSSFQLKKLIVLFFVLLFATISENQAQVSKRRHGISLMRTDSVREKVIALTDSADHVASGRDPDNLKGINNENPQLSPIILGKKEKNNSRFLILTGSIILLILLLVIAYVIKRKR